MKVRSILTNSEIGEESNKIDMEVGDRIIVIDGQPDHFWWKGQNIRTFQVGRFPRYVVVLLRSYQF